MTRAFRDDDRDKSVFTQEGERIGTISSVDGERAKVRRGDDRSLTDEIKNLLDWDENDDEHDLHQDHVDRHDDRGVHLRSKQDITAFDRVP